MKYKILPFLILCCSLNCDKGFDVKFFLHNNTNESLTIELFKNNLIEVEKIPPFQELIILNFENLLGSEFHRISTIDSIEIRTSNDQKILWKKPSNGFLNQNSQEKNFYNYVFWTEKVNDKQEHYIFKIDQNDLVLFN